MPFTPMDIESAPPQSSPRRAIARGRCGDSHTVLRVLLGVAAVVIVVLAAVVAALAVAVARHKGGGSSDGGGGGGGSDTVDSSFVRSVQLPGLMRTMRDLQTIADSHTSSRSVLNGANASVEYIASRVRAETTFTATEHTFDLVLSVGRTLSQPVLQVRALTLVLEVSSRLLASRAPHLLAQRRAALCRRAATRLALCT